MDLKRKLLKMKKLKPNKIHPASFRDNDGFIFFSRGQLLRQVNQSYQADYDLLNSSGLYKKLIEEELLISHRELALNLAVNNDAYKVLRPRQLDFISYPYEWCFSQLKQAALTTLNIQTIALEYGMSLKDAGGFNIQFLNGRPILIDSLSFERFDNRPWVAYRQFCQHFLNPLILMSKIDPGLNRLLAIYPDGIPADLTAKLLPFWSKLNPAVFIHIQLHAKVKGKAGSGQASFSKNAMKGLISSLEGAVTGLKLDQMKSFWSSYAPAHDSYTASGFKNKEQIVGDLFKKTKAKKVWDLGSNTGYFSRLVAQKGTEVVSFDLDPLSVEKNYQLSGKYGNILPLVADLTNPTPALGWGNEERESLIQRGPVDCVLALALIHHLAIGANLPMEKIAKLFSEICQNLIIEFVPKADPQIKEMLLIRKDIFTDYNEKNFKQSFGKYFKIVNGKKIKDGLRSIYLMKVI